jgi:hypothetical protein
LREIVGICHFVGPSGEVGTIFCGRWITQVIDGERPSVHGKDSAHAHEVDIEMERALWVADAKHKVVEFEPGRGAIFRERGVGFVPPGEERAELERRRGGLQIAHPEN